MASEEWPPPCQHGVAWGQCEECPDPEAHGPECGCAACYLQYGGSRE